MFSNIEHIFTFRNFGVGLQHEWPMSWKTMSSKLINISLLISTLILLLTLYFLYTLTSS